MDTEPTLETNDFRVFLQEELVKRCRKNPKYSLRSFAKFLGIGSSDLSKIINKRRAVTMATLNKLGERLELSPERIDAFSRYIAKQTNQKKRTPNLMDTSSSQFKQIEYDVFSVVSNWYHMAILELIKTKNFVPDARLVARCLGITPSEVNVALERLQRVGYLEITEDGQWVDLSGSTTNIKETYTNAASKKLHRQILTKAIDAMDDTPVLDRNQSAILMAVNKSRLPEARTLIKNFRRNLCEFFEEDIDRDEVYYLSVSLFPVSNSDKGEHDV